MSEHPQAQMHPQEELRLGHRAADLRRRAWILAAVGLILAVLHAVVTTDGCRRFLLAYLVAFAFVLSLALGALFFVLLQHLTRAGWSVLVRRPAELMAAGLPVVALLFIPIAVSVAAGHGKIYPWAQPVATIEKAVQDHAAAQHAQPVTHEGTAEHASQEAPEASSRASGGEAVGGHHGVEEFLTSHQTLDEFTLKKRPFLNPTFFLLRWVLYFTLWAGLALWLFRHSTRQDHDRDPAHTMRVEKWAGLGVLAFGLSITFASFDLLMSLNPHWYSTMFGVYYFSGSMIAVYASLILIVTAIQRSGLLIRSISVEHYHDLGKFLFGFVFFWGYIAFSQFMLIWYANMPETTGWYALRGITTVPGQMNAWTCVGLVLLVGHFILPFAGLLSRHVKRRKVFLGAWAVWLLAMHYIDLLWLVMPEFSTRLTLGLVEIGLLVALTSLFAVAVISKARRYPLAPVGDPRLSDSLRFTNVY